jgi:predicted DCC family thiol-disulfide oxidoreductase YuxK
MTSSPENENSTAAGRVNKINTDSSKQLLDSPILLFDGQCTLCNSLVRFLIRFDPHGRIRFAALPSEVGRRLLQVCASGTPPSLPDTVVLFYQGRCYIKSEAALQTMGHLGGLFAWISRVLALIPLAFRDWVYDWIARNRYTWFGKNKICPAPSPADQHRFLSDT